MPPVVFAFGSNGCGQLAIGNREDIATPTQCHFHDEQPPARAHPVSIAAGGNHTLLLYSNGFVYAAGQNEDGRCGLAGVHRASQDPASGQGVEVEDTCYTTFHRVRFYSTDGANVDRFSEISATWSASFFLTERDDIYVAGTGFKGELGLGYAQASSPTSTPTLITSAPTPTLVPFPRTTGSRVRKLVSGVNHTVAVSTDGVYGWGCARHGELGMSCEAVASSCRKLGDVRLFSGLQVVCGLNYTYALRAVQDQQPLAAQAVRGAGPQQHFLFGPSTRHPLSTKLPTLTGEVDWVESASSWNTIYLTNSKGQVLSWGRGERGQLAPGDVANGQEGGGVEKLCAGSEHVLALGKDARVRAWGWGEHGNCGPEHETGDKSSEWTEIVVEGERACTPLGAGCATSFVVVND